LVIRWTGERNAVSRGSSPFNSRNNEAIWDSKCAISIALSCTRISEQNSRHTAKLDFGKNCFINGFANESEPFWDFWFVPLQEIHLKFEKYLSRSTFEISPVINCRQAFAYRTAWPHSGENRVKLVRTGMHQASIFHSVIVWVFSIGSANSQGVLEKLMLAIPDRLYMLTIRLLHRPEKGDDRRVQDSIQ
jgi:hypothetical protein